MENSKEKSSKSARKLVVLIIFLILLGLAIFVIIPQFLNSRKNNTSDANNNSKPSKTITEVPTKKNEEYVEESEDLILNFKDTQVAFFGYPYTAKPYYPKLFTLVYINSVSNEQQWIDTYLPESTKWEGSYQSSTSEPKIYFVTSKDSPNDKVWQSMEIINISEIETKLPDCTARAYELGDLKLASYTCTNSSDYSASDPCFIEVTKDQGILYLQHTNNPSIKRNMCDVLRDNRVTGVEFGKYY
ncbi:hypothetical protein KBD45_02330 [Candidatus Dojkabacteria bacterium]|nr:hypothetical protein [Candidatus Dojkabacteria bacterium]